jgi:hypothetical protein
MHFKIIQSNSILYDKFMHYTWKILQNHSLIILIDANCIICPPKCFLCYMYGHVSKTFHYKSEINTHIKYTTALYVSTHYIRNVSWEDAL